MYVKFVIKVNSQKTGANEINCTEATNEKCREFSVVKSNRHFLWVGPPVKKVLLILRNNKITPIIFLNNSR